MKIQKIIDNLTSYLENNKDTKSKYNMCAATFTNKILTYGSPNHNRSTSFGLNKIALHAEEEAIRQLYPEYAKYFRRILCGKMLFKGKKKVDIIVIKLNNNNYTNSKCCSVCYSIMKAFSIRNVYYFNEFGKLIKEKINLFKPDYESSGYEYLMQIDLKSNNNIIYIIKNKINLNKLNSK